MIISDISLHSCGKDEAVRRRLLKDFQMGLCDRAIFQRTTLLVPMKAVIDEPTLDQDRVLSTAQFFDG